MSTVRLTEDTWTVTSDINCNSGDKKLRDCLPDSLNTRHMGEVAGLICSAFTTYIIIYSEFACCRILLYIIDCIEGALRLVDGSSHNEGRVEVCSNGRWGTVCGDGWTPREAGLVCSRLGYPTLRMAMIVHCIF